MVGNKSPYLDKLKNESPAKRNENYCSFCGCDIRLVVNHPEAHLLRLQGKIIDAWIYLAPKTEHDKSKNFPADYLLEDNKTINPKYLIKKTK